MKSRFKSRRFLARVATVGAILGGLWAPHGAYAQGAGAAAVGDSYRLTMATLRKVIPALYIPGRAQWERRQDRRQDPLALTLAELTARLGSCSPVKAAFVKSGASTREAAQALAVFLRASRRHTDDGSAKTVGKQVPPLEPGVLRDNVALLRGNEVELGQLATVQEKPGGGS